MKLSETMAASTPLEMGKSLWRFGTGRYFYVMAQYLIHSGLANAISWIKLLFLCSVGTLCVVIPILWPLFLFWVYQKYQSYAASRAKLLPSWTGPGSLEQKVLKAIEKNEPPKNGKFQNRDGLSLHYYSEGRGSKHVLICNGVTLS